MKRSMRRFGFIKASLLLAAFVSAILSSCTKSPKSSFPSKMNVMLIIVDTLPVRFLGTYGSATKTPNIDALANSGVKFSKAFSAAPWTKPAIATIMSGVMPNKHGAIRLHLPVNKNVKMLAEYFKEKGWNTASIVSHILLGRKDGFTKGFDSYENTNPSRPHIAIVGEKVTNSAIKWLDNYKSDKNFFMFLHYFDPHYNYNHHAKFDQTSAIKSQLQPAMDVRKVRATKFTNDDITYLRGLFAEEVAYTDEQLGRLFTHMKEKGFDKNTLVIFVADHGEELMERGWVGHTKDLYNELIHVPLILSLPGVIEPKVVNENVASYDIFKTLLDIINPKNDYAGYSNSLAPFIFNQRRKIDKNRVILSDVNFASSGHVKDANMVSAVSGKYKLIHDRKTNTFSLFDFEADPKELKDISKNHPEIVKQLAEKIINYEDDTTSVTNSSIKITPKEVKQLESLGYM